MICRNSTEENKTRYKSTKNKGKKADSKAIREKAEEALAELKDCPNGMYRNVKGLRIDSKEGEFG